MLTQTKMPSQDENISLYPITVGHATDQGRKKQTNQDSLAVVLGSELRNKVEALLIVADGHGPIGPGERASAVTVQTFTERFDEILRGDGMPDSPWLKKAMQHCAERANAAVRATRQDESAPEETGTTCTTAIISDGRLIVGSVGDSRCYLIRERNIEQITSDHSVIRQSEGVLRTFLGRAIGWEPFVDVECFEVPLTSGDLILLATDGLNRMLSDNDMLRLAQKYPDPETLATQLIQASNTRGGYDNVSVITVRYGPEPKQVRSESPLHKLFHPRG